MKLPSSRLALLLALAGLCSCSCSCSGRPGPIIDAHIHTAFTGKPERTSHIPVTLQEYQRQMRQAGVSAAIAHSGKDGEGAADLRQHHIFHCAGVNARVDTARVEAGLQAGLYRCIKIYLGYVPQLASDPAYEPAYALALKYDVPVVFHTGDTYSNTALVKFADPLTLDEVAVAHPRLRMVIAHCGNPWIESAAEVAYKNPNVYLEGSALLIGDLGHASSQKIDRYVVQPLSWALGYLEDPSKLLFGTDWPLTDVPSYVAAFQKAVPKADWQAVFHDNAARVFRIQD